jgi:hypothetical protein
MSAPALIFFFLFVIVIVFTYIALRRNMFPRRPLIIGCVSGSILALTVMSLLQGAIFIQALLTGVVLGAVFSASTVVIALYFHANEARTKSS